MKIFVHIVFISVLSIVRVGGLYTCMVPVNDAFKSLIEALEMSQSDLKSGDLGGVNVNSEQILFRVPLCPIQVNPEQELYRDF